MRACMQKRLLLWLVGCGRGGGCWWLVTWDDFFLEEEKETHERERGVLEKNGGLGRD